jgi:hypothetical protein
VEQTLPILIAALGFFAGSVVAQQVLRWIALLSVAISKHGGDFLGPPRRRLLWLLPLVVFLHPGLYLISALVVITGCGLLNRLSGEWGWFLVGLYIYTIISAASTYRRFRRKSRRT